MKRITKAQLSAILFKHDPEGFGRMGAPEDEYDFEAEMLWDTIETLRNVIPGNPSLKEVEESILKIFLYTLASAGENPYPAGTFAAVAYEIFEAL